jgi:hypothetical protein
MYLENLSLNETPHPNWMDYTHLFLHVTWEHITNMKLKNLWQKNTKSKPNFDDNIKGTKKGLHF